MSFLFYLAADTSKFNLQLVTYLFFCTSYFLSCCSTPTVRFRSDLRSGLGLCHSNDGLVPTERSAGDAGGSNVDRLRARLVLRESGTRTSGSTFAWKKGPHDLNPGRIKGGYEDIKDV